MTVDNLKAVVALAKTLQCNAVFFNEESRIIATVSESGRTFFDDDNGIMFTIRTNVDYSSDKKYTASFIEYDSIKMANIDLTASEVFKFAEEKGIDADALKEFLETTGQQFTRMPSNFNKKTDEDGNEIYNNDPFIPTVRQI